MAMLSVFRGADEWFFGLREIFLNLIGHVLHILLNKTNKTKKYFKVKK